MSRKRQEVIIYVGGHASGKTAQANAVAKTNPRYTVIERGDIHKGREVTEQKLGRDYNNAVKAALDSGLSVIASDISFNQAAQAAIGKITDSRNVPVVIDDSFMAIPFSERLKRDTDSAEPRGKDTLLKELYANIYPKDPSKHPDWKDKKSRAFVFDVDGTLAVINRSPYDAEKYYTDTTHSTISLIADLMSVYHTDLTRKSTGYVYTIIVTGRDEKYRDITEDWLDAQDIEYDELHMRPSGDKREDGVVKSEIYHNDLKPKYNIVGWIEDRPKVVDVIRRDLLLPVLQIADHDNKF